MKHATPEQVKLFKEWLVDHGAIIQDTTNEYEVLRYSLDGLVGIAYMSKKTSPNISKGNPVCTVHWFSMLKPKQKKIKRKTIPQNRRGSIIQKLRRRDGHDCWYCGINFDNNNKPTIEHMVAVVFGGPNHTSNYVLACKSCNEKAGTLSVSEKVSLRDKLTQSS